MPEGTLQRRNSMKAKAPRGNVPEGNLSLTEVNVPSRHAPEMNLSHFKAGKVPRFRGACAKGGPLWRSLRGDAPD